MTINSKKISTPRLLVILQNAIESIFLEVKVKVFCLLLYSKALRTFYL